MSRFKKIFSTPNLVALITGLLLYSLAPQQPIHERFSLLERVAPALVLLLITLFARKQQIVNWIIPIPVVVLLVIMAISIAQMPEFFIVKDLLAFALLTLFAIVAVSSVGPRAPILGVLLSCILIMVTSIAYAILLPSLAFESPGVLRGAFYGSNSLALSLILVCPAISVAGLRSPKATIALRTLLLLSVFVIIYVSTSRTSLIVFFVMLLAWAFFKLIKKSLKITIVAIAIASSLLITLATNWVLITSALGKSSDLSGRFPLWSAYLEAISLKPLQGYGWHLRTTADMPLGNFILETTGHSQINANNDLLNWWSLTGFFGAFFALIAVIYVITNGIRVRNISTFAIWIFLSGAVLLFAGFTELSTMHPDGWFILALALVSSYGSESNKWSSARQTLATGLASFGKHKE